MDMGRDELPYMYMMRYMVGHGGRVVAVQKGKSTKVANGGESGEGVLTAQHRLQHPREGDVLALLATAVDERHNSC